MSMNEITNSTPSELSGAPDWALTVFEALPLLCGYDDPSRVSGMSRGGIANLCSARNSPANGFLMGRRRVYPRLDAVLWLVRFAESKAAKA